MVGQYHSPAHYAITVKDSETLYRKPGVSAHQIKELGDLTVPS